MEKNMKKFLFEVMQTYPVYGDCAKEKVITDTCNYLLEKLGKEEIDFEKAKNLIFTGYTRKSFPSPNEILTYLKRSVIRRKNPEISDGSWYLLTLPSGAKYSFTPAPFGRTIEEYKQEWQEKYEDFTLEKYGKESVLIGNKVFTPKDYGNQKGNEIFKKSFEIYTKKFVKGV